MYELEHAIDLSDFECAFARPQNTSNVEGARQSTYVAYNGAHFSYANGNKWLVSHFLLVAIFRFAVLEDTGNSSQVERATDDAKCICHRKEKGRDIKNRIKLRIFDEK